MGEAAQIKVRGGGTLPTAPRGDTGERAYRALHAAIVDGSISPGKRLVEAALCEWLQVSRTPVREALRQLRSNGLVEVGPSGGLQVASYDLAALNELYVVREMLEATAAGEAARNASEAEIMALQDSLRRQRDSVRDFETFSRENVVFHRLLYAAAHNRFLLRTLAALSDSGALLGSTAIDRPEAVDRALSQHARLASAIAKRDAQKAFEIMRQHIRTGFARRARNFGAESEDVRDKAAVNDLLRSA
jgi:DNA-binding GntR family transcriptional regulator